MIHIAIIDMIHIAIIDMIHIAIIGMIHIAVIITIIIINIFYTNSCTISYFFEKYKYYIIYIVGILAKDVKSKIGSFDLMMQYCKVCNVLQTGKIHKIE